MVQKIDSTADFSADKEVGLALSVNATEDTRKKILKIVDRIKGCQRETTVEVRTYVPTSKHRK